MVPGPDPDGMEVSMITDTQKKLLEEFNRQFGEAGYETRFKEEDGLYFLQAALIGLGEEEKGNALMELCFVPIDEEGKEDIGDVILFQIHTTFLDKVPEKKEKNILTGLNELNMECLLGAYGIFHQEQQIYHRYITVLNSADFDQLKGTVGPALNFILSMVYDDYDGIKKLFK